MEVIFLILLIVFVLFFLGYGFTVLYLPNKLIKERIWLSPWVGAILIAAYTPILLFGRVPMILGIFVITLFVLSINIYALFKIYPLFHKKFKYIFLLSILMILLYLLLLDFSEFMDIIKNITIHISINPEEFRLNMIQNGYFVGIYSIIDFFTILLKQKITLIINILPIVFLISFFPIIFIVIGLIFSKKDIYFRLTLSLSLLIIFYFFIIYSNLALNKLIFTGVISFLLINFFDYFSNLLKSKQNMSNINLYDILLAISINSLATIYPAGFKIFFALFIILILSSLFLRQKINVFYTLIKIFFLMLIINPIIISMAFYVK